MPANLESLQKLRLHEQRQPIAPLRRVQISDHGRTGHDHDVLAIERLYRTRLRNEDLAAGRATGLSVGGGQAERVERGVPPPTKAQPARPTDRKTAAEKHPQQSGSPAGHTIQLPARIRHVICSSFPGPNSADRRPTRRGLGGKAVVAVNRSGALRTLYRVHGRVCVAGRSRSACLCPRRPGASDAFARHRCAPRLRLQ